MTALPLAPVALAMVLALAPVQCGEPEPIRYARTDDPAQAVFDLGQRLRLRGEARAAREAWTYVIERWPASRWAERSRIELEGADAGPGQAAP